MSAPRVWLINLEAESEIEGARSSPFAAFEARPELEETVATIVPSGDRILRSDDPRGAAEGARGFAWAMTPLARSTLRRAGAACSDEPRQEVLHTVMSRAFSHELGPAFEDARFERAAVDAASLAGTAWLARRCFGFAGRGRRVLRAPPAAADLAFVDKAVRDGGVLLEPFVEVLADFAIHGFIRGESVVLGRPTTTTVGPGGVWRGSRQASADDLSNRERAALEDEVSRAGRALAAAGYAGAFGIDAFRYRRGQKEGFCPRCEINARYSMGWGVGMAERRPDLE